MSTQSAAKWFGWVLLVIGVLGFVPGVVNASGFLFGIFGVNSLHNVIYIVTGLLALSSAGTLKAAKTYFKVIGIVYGLVAILGFAMHVLMTTNTADNILHAVIALYALYYGFRMAPAVVAAM